MTKYEVLRGCWIIFVGLFGYDQFVTKIRKTMDKRSQLETSKKVGTLANARTATYNGREGTCSHRDQSPPVLHHYQQRQQHHRGGGRQHYPHSLTQGRAPVITTRARLKLLSHKN